MVNSNKPIPTTTKEPLFFCKTTKPTSCWGCRHDPNEAEELNGIICRKSAAGCLGFSEYESYGATRLKKC